MSYWIINVRFAFHPDGFSFRGLCQVGGLTSVCNHAHSTEKAAIRCAQKKRASYKRGEWAKIDAK